jgi:hypothetical protein
MNHWSKACEILYVDHKFIYIFCINHFLYIKVTCMVMVTNFEVMPGKFNIVKICTSGNYAQKWMINCVIINLYIFSAGPTNVN